MKSLPMKNLPMKSLLMTVPDGGYRVLIADDHPLVREGMRSMLTDVEDIELIGEASDGLEASRKTDELRPDVVIIDIRMTGMDGIEATRRIKDSHPKTAVLVLT